jgi:hypothetical protein
MGIETLNTAARAAGFAMATSEESFDEVYPSAARAANAQRRPDEAAPVHEPSSERGDWLRAVLSLFGRRARVSPA